MRVTVLGTSSALPTSGRYPSAHALNVHEQIFLIDCGEGTQMQIRRAKLRFNKINHIFITHLHGDHLFGLYGLLSSFSLMGRAVPLHIYAPENYERILNAHLNDFMINLNFEIVFVPLKGNGIFQIFEDKHITVDAFPLEHRVPTFGFIFREKERDRNIIKECVERYEIPHVRIPAIKKGADFVTKDDVIVKNEDITLPAPKPRSYAYCSDTKYCRKVAKYVKEVDLLYHEATFKKELEDLAKVTCHSTATDAATIAMEAHAGKLLIGHFSSRYKDIDELVDEARTIFPNTSAAQELQTYDV